MASTCMVRSWAQRQVAKWFSAFLWEDGVMTSCGGASSAYGINGSGQVVGDSFTASGNYHAVLWVPLDNSFYCPVIQQVGP